MTSFDPAFTPEERRQVLSQHGGSHPLEMFPVFRRWAPSLVRDLIYTFIWNMGFTALFTFFGIVSNWRLPSANWLWVNFVIANCVGYTLHLLFHVGAVTVEPVARRAGRVAVTAYFMGVSTAGVIAGFWIATRLLGRDILPRLGDPRWIIAIAVTSLVISIVIAVIFFWREKSAQAEAALEREQRRVADIEREATVANLRALQAQIEPHFLFNTLANVTGLIDADPARAKHMLETFIRFLRASLAATRRSTTTLADEFALIGDFLEVLRVRMGDRLRVRLDLPAELSTIEIPPMLVQPLVENAIRHGLETKVEGGVIELSARRDGERLVLEVADTGTGFRDATSAGVGLANVRERLLLAHGAKARLTIRENAPQGTIVAIELPLAAQ
jgi:signal transduction histidine kinase